MLTLDELILGNKRFHRNGMVFARINIRVFFGDDIIKEAVKFFRFSQSSNLFREFHEHLSNIKTVQSGLIRIRRKKLAILAQINDVQDTLYILVPTYRPDLVSVHESIYSGVMNKYDDKDLYRSLMSSNVDFRVYVISTIKNKGIGCCKDKRCKGIHHIDDIWGCGHEFLV